jgi:hypothetical protein
MRTPDLVECGGKSYYLTYGDHELSNDCKACELPDCTNTEVGFDCSEEGAHYLEVEVADKPKKVSEKHNQAYLEYIKLGEDLEVGPPDLEVDKKKDDITKAKPGQMLDDFNLALLAVSEVTRYGIEKYERPGSWKHAHKDLMKYKDAAGRHNLKQPTEMYDDESGYLHLIQVVWNGLAELQMRLEFDKTKPRDISKITRPIEGLTQSEPEWFKGEE